VKVGVPRETAPGERRVALVPETVARLVGSGFEVAVEADAGASASFLDEAFVQAGAAIVERALDDEADVPLSSPQPASAKAVTRTARGSRRIHPSLPPQPDDRFV